MKKVLLANLFIQILKSNITLDINQNALNTNDYNTFYDGQYVNFLKNFLKENDLIFDVGANVGKLTSRYLDCKCKVICFEPQPDCVNALKKLFKDNKLVIIEPIGLSAKKGFLDLFICEESNTISTFSNLWTTKSRFSKKKFIWNKTIKVEVSTLKEMIKKYGIPKFIKIDVEGFEYEVLSGLTQPVDLISFEFAQEEFANAIKCIIYLSKLGYKKFNFVIGEMSEFLFSEWQSPENFTKNLQYISKIKNWENIWGLWGDIYAKL